MTAAASLTIPTVTPKPLAGSPSSSFRMQRSCVLTMSGPRRHVGQFRAAEAIHRRGGHEFLKDPPVGVGLAIASAAPDGDGDGLKKPSRSSSFVCLGFEKNPYPLARDHALSFPRRRSHSAVGE